jgi:hypothetical protein
LYKPASKRFFFEKKKQKTFGMLTSSRAPSWEAPGKPGASRDGAATTSAFQKFFWFFFYKKRTASLTFNQEFPVQ